MVTTPVRGGGSASVKRTGARVDGMVNRCELLINVVKNEEPKTLIGSAQKGSGQVQGRLSPLSWMKHHRRIERT